MAWKVAAAVAAPVMLFGPMVNVWIAVFALFVFVIGLGVTVEDS